MPTARHLTRTAALAGLLIGTPLAQAEGAAPSAELRLHWDARSTNATGPIAAANQLSPGTAAPTPSALVSEAELRHTAHARLAGQAWSLGTGLLAWGEQPEGRAATARARVNELHLGTELGSLSLSAGKKVIGWDVAYGFRPNDTVQQEARRTLLASNPEGRGLLQLEHFGADTATALVWVNPQRLNDPTDATRGAGESALALHTYRRSGAVDWHGFARAGRHTGASLGAAVAWVAGDETELHASWRAMLRHDGWQSPLGASPAPVAINPWQQQTLGATQQWLLGLIWTGTLQQSLIVEAWHDGTAPSDAQWRTWHRRNAGLLASPAPAAARAGNLAWQTSPFNGQSLRRDNLFVRAAWQPGEWTLSLDALVTPIDGGHAFTAAVQWQGNRVRLNAAWRIYGGPADALMTQLPQKHSGVVAATVAF
ncbi:MAG: hypothetical protein IPJ08_18875 [Burkholderiales bacterium]|nr:hypothetical protein [Burkholderiales bacterium]MBP6675188.1 hypothetical protein [Vitreoscilla sp.]